MPWSSSKNIFKTYLHPQWMPLIAVTTITVASMGVYWSRKTKIDPELQRFKPGELPVTDLHENATQKQPFGRKSAEATGLMEGDRPYQGIFPAKKMTEKLGPLISSNKSEEELAKENLPKSEK